MSKKERMEALLGALDHARPGSESNNTKPRFSEFLMNFMNNIPMITTTRRREIQRRPRFGKTSEETCRALTMMRQTGQSIVRQYERLTSRRCMMGEHESEKPW